MNNSALSVAMIALLMLVGLLGLPEALLCRNYALLFDGDDEVVIPHDSSINLYPGSKFTVEMWFMQTANQATYHLLGKRYECSQQCNYQLARDPLSQLLFYSGGAGGYAVSTGLNPAINQWTHIAVTYDSDTLLMFVDGQLIVTTPYAVSGENTEPLKFGASTGASCCCNLIGLIDEVRIWNIVRTPAEIVAYYNRTVDSRTPGLVGYWTFDDDSTDQIAHDWSLTGNDGTLGANSSIAFDDPFRVLSTAPVTMLDHYAAFVFAPDSGFAPLTVQMTDQSALTPTSWRWSFGDGDSSAEQNPIHAYQLPGTYHPQLIACNMQECDTAAATHPIRVFDSLTVDFSAAPTRGRKPVWVSFTPQCSLQPDSVRWLFGDGNTSVTPNPIHKYQNSGVYDVTLNTYKFRSTFTLHKSEFVKVSDVRASFGANVRCGGTPLTVAFTDLSTSSNPLTGWYWEFEDGQTSTQQNPTHEFASVRTYDIRLIVSDGVGADTLTKADYVTIQESLSVDFAGGPTGGRSPLTVMFDPLLQGIANEYQWDFGDGDTSSLPNPIHIYQAQGIYSVKFRARLNLDGCDQVDSIMKSAYIIINDLQPEFVASPTAGYEPLTIQFADSSKGNPTGWYWDFGDGSSSTAQNPSHTYYSDNSYDVFLRVTNGVGVDSLKKLSYIHVDSVYVDLEGQIMKRGWVQFRPGFPFNLVFFWANLGTTPAANCELKVLLPPELVFSGIDWIYTGTGTYSGYSLSGDTLVIPLQTIGPSYWFGGFVQAHGQIPETVPIGDTLICKSWLTTTSPESRLANNHVVENLIVIGSWDPNDKIADPGGRERSFGVAPDQRINYSVQFENKEEATAEAIYVCVVDTLDTDLDWGTLSIGPMSHPDKCVASFDPYKGIITWFCDSIMLPPNVTPPEGEGYFTYSIKPKPNLSTGTQIANLAWIRFDYNPWLRAPKDGPIVKTIQPSYICGDASSDDFVDISDAVSLISYIFSGGLAPNPLAAGDANCDSMVDISDAVYLIAYIFSGGGAPCAGCK
jgi:PKD repeat protein